MLPAVLPDMMVNVYPCLQYLQCWSCLEGDGGYIEQKSGCCALSYSFTYQPFPTCVPGFRVPVQLAPGYNSVALWVYTMGYNKSGCAERVVDLSLLL